MSIPESTIQKVLNSVDIVEVIGESVRLTKAGRNFKARCPFHNEKTPSFMVSTEKQIFHCFGCNVGGNAISFVMKMEGLTYPEAIKKLAQKCGIEIKEEYSGKDAGQPQEREIIFKILEETAVFYQQFFDRDKIAKNWVKKRGISEDTIKKFRIGYAPASSKTLLNAAIKKGYSRELLQKAGVVSSDKDFFYNRIIFPIFDITGRVVAFGGRVLDDPPQRTLPKYINSPETSVYSKSRVLYGLNFAGKVIRDEGSAVILEGYIDVVMCHQFGFKNTVATLGTAFTQQHSSVLKRYTDNVVIAYDADNAGRSSALRSCDVLLADDLHVRVAQLPDGKDSDEILLSGGPDKLKTVFSNAKSYIDFLIDWKSGSFDPGTIEGKRDIAKIVLPVISKIPNAIVKSEYIKMLSERFGIKEEILNSEMAKIKPVFPRPASTDGIITKKNVSLAEHNLISVLIKDLKLIDSLPDFVQEDFNSPEIKKIFDLLLKLRKNGTASVKPSELVEMLGSDYVTQILMDDDGITDSDRFIKSYREAVLFNRDKRKLERLKKEDLSEFIKISKKIKGSKK
ncbi:MAG: DNA primase [Elusimicrobia bacterium]|nr:DNA primase [Elusimicrobiota bacterium]